MDIKTLIESNWLVVTIILLISHGANAYILRLPCLTYANFSIVKPDHVLNGDVLETYNDLTEDECENRCIEHRSCKSINTKSSTGENCQLIGTSTEDPFDNVKLSATAGWTYKSTDHEARNIGYLCQEINPCPEVRTCTDTCVYPGYECQLTKTEPVNNCQEAYKNGYTSTSILPILIPGMGIVNVRCDMVTDGGGWIVFQRRVDASVDFYRVWDEYKNGFGDLNGNFWLGLEKLHKLTSLGKEAILRVDLKHFKNPNTIKYEIYNKFMITSESDRYRLKFIGYSGNAGDSLSEHLNYPFSTWDRGSNCAQTHQGAWWYKKCLHSDLNSRYPQNREELDSFISWHSLEKSWGGIIFSEMKLKYSSP